MLFFLSFIGGMGGGVIDGCLVGEEIAYACTGIGSAIGINGIAVCTILIYVTVYC